MPNPLTQLHKRHLEVGLRRKRIGDDVYDLLALLVAQCADPLLPGTGEIPPGTSFVRVDTSEVGYYDLFLPSTMHPLSANSLTLKHDDGEAIVRLWPSTAADGIDGGPGASFVLEPGQSATFRAWYDADSGVGKWVLV